MVNPRHHPGEDKTSHPQSECAKRGCGGERTEMNNQHTPGPWTWIRDVGRGDAIDGPDRMPVAWVATDCRRGDRSAYEYEANAALIAAAPALRDALRDMLRQIDQVDAGRLAGAPSIATLYAARALLRSLDG